MGLFSEKLHQGDGDGDGGGGGESESKKWVISGIQLRAPLKPVFTSASTNHARKEREEEGGGEEEEEEECSTPTNKEARIPTTPACPPPPRKRKSPSRCSCNGVKEFFTPPDLETVFIRRVERATSSLTIGYI